MLNMFLGLQMILDYVWELGLEQVDVSLREEMSEQAKVFGVG